MALINRNEPKEPVIKQSANTSRTSIEKTNIKKKQLTAADRKNIKVAPDSFSMIKTICTMKSMKNYEFIDELLEFYIENNLSDREKRILKNIISSQEKI